MKFLFLFLFPLAAFAQSVPNGTITQGEVWTPAQWNYAWQSKQDYPIPSGGVPFSALPSLSPNTVLGSVAGGAPTALPTGKVINVLQPPYNVVCDGVTDNATAFASISSGAVSGNVIYFPPQPSACMTSAALTPATGVTVWAYPGTVTIQATAANAANPMLLKTTGTNGVTVHGLIFDGNFAYPTPSAWGACGSGGGAPLCNALVTSAGDTNITYEDSVFQNNSGRGLVFTTNAGSGSSGIIVRDNQFSNLGNNFIASLTATDRQFGLLLFCASNTTCSGGINILNTISGNKFTSIGLDSIYLSNTTNVNITNNRCENQQSQAAQFALNVTGGLGWPTCIGGVTVTNVNVVGNFSDHSAGDGIAIGGIGTNIVANTVQYSGGAGITVPFGSNHVVVGNTITNNWQNNVAVPPGIANFHNGGISVDTHGTNISNVVIDGNIITDNQGSPTQKYGISWYTNGSANTFTNYTIGTSNNLSGNVTGPFSTATATYAALDYTLPSTALEAPPAIGAVTPAAGAFTTLSASTGYNGIVGGVTPAAGSFTTVTPRISTFPGGVVHGVTVLCSYAGAVTPPTGAYIHTGDTNETNLATCAIPANALGSNGSLRIIATWYRSATTTNTVTFSERYGSSGIVSGGTIIKLDAVSTTSWVTYTNIGQMINTATNAQTVPNQQDGNAAGMGGGFGGSTTATAFGTQDSTGLLYVNFNCKDTTSSSDSCGLMTYTVELIQP